MKKTSLSEIKNLDIKTLTAKVLNLQAEIAKLQLDKDKKDLKLVAKKRDDLAQVLTILQQKTLLENLKEVTK